MRVLMIGDGAASAVTRPLTWMLGAGCSVWLMSRENPYSARPPGGFHFIQASSLEHGERADAAWWQARTAELRDLVQRIKPSVLHLHGLGEQADLRAAVGLPPLVISVWGWLNRLVDGTGSTQPDQLDQLLASAQALVVESPALLRAARSRFTKGPRIELIPMGVDSTRFRPADQAQRLAWRRTLGIAKEAFVILSPRGWGHVYNHALILDAFHRARSRFRRPVLLAVTRMGRNTQRGEAEGVYQSFLREAEARGISDLVLSLPALPFDLMPGLFAMADAVVSYPSQDAFPATLIEATACELPLLSARLPAYAGTFVETCADLIEPGSVQALADGLVHVVNQPPAERLDRLRRARAEVVEQYDQQVCADRLLRLYHDLATPLAPPH